MIRIIALIILHTIGISFSSAQTKSEEILIKNDSIELPGTLTYTKENTPLIIWIHGSGNIDRNGNQGNAVKANYIKQFRKAINVNDIAFFSYDKRTSNPKNFKFLNGILFDDLVNDAKKVINHFKNDTRFSEIILVGHSQGSLIAMLAIEKTDKYISLAGPSEPIDVTITRQVTNQSTELGKITESHFKELKETGDIKEVNPMLLSIFAKPNMPFFASWMKYNPSEVIKSVKVPTLIINGNKDLQVKVKDAEKLHKSKPTATLTIIDNMNHILIELEKDSDNLKSYSTPGFLISDELIVSILNFVKK